MKNQVLSLLGIARRAGRLSLGHDAVDEALKKREAKLILLARDVSARRHRRRRSRPKSPAWPLRTGWKRSAWL